MCSEKKIDAGVVDEREVADPRSILRAAFLSHSAWADWDVEALSADASFRRYFRLSRDGQSALLMDSPPDTEDIDSYVKIDQYLLSVGLRAPKIHQLDAVNGFAIIEDFGAQTYTQLLNAGSDSQPLYALATDAIMRLHEGLDVKAIDVPRYDAGFYDREAALFIDWYWPARTGVKISGDLRREFTDLWRQLFAGINTEKECMVLRDYHVDNLMLIDGETGLESCGLLDFQDALIGSRAYDLVSLFEDARRDVDPAMAKQLLEHYLVDFTPQEAAGFHYDYAVLGAHRHMKVLGIFVRLCVRDGKAHYLNYLPRVQRLLAQSLKAPEMQPLAQWLGRNHPGAVTEPLDFDVERLHDMLCDSSHN